MLRLTDTRRRNHTCYLFPSLTHTHVHALLGAKVSRAPQTEKFPWIVFGISSQRIDLMWKGVARSMVKAGGGGATSRILRITVVCLLLLLFFAIACSCSHVQRPFLFLSVLCCDRCRRRRRRRRVCLHFCSRDSYPFPLFDMFYKCS